MKGFIEITTSSNKTELINVAHIIKVKIYRTGTFIACVAEASVTAKESYEEVKALIDKATGDSVESKYNNSDEEVFI